MTRCATLPDSLHRRCRKTPTRVQVEAHAAPQQLALTSPPQHRRSPRATAADVRAAIETVRRNNGRMPR